MESLAANITATCPLSFGGTAGELFLKAVTTVITAHCGIMDDYKWPPDDAYDIINKGSGISFDFIVVGAGTAGSLIASRLSKQYPSWNILLIEAGDDPGIDSEIPAFLFLNQNSSNDWSYTTEGRGESCLGFNNEKCIWSKGKGLGGSSSINAMIYLRGHPKDYNTWEKLGNPGWGYKEMSKYFDKIENIFNITDPHFSGYENQWYKILDNAWKELSFANYNYENHEALTGTKKTRLLTRNGKRMNTAKAFFNQAGKMTVMKNTQVEKVIINPKTKRATGVKIHHKDGTIMEIDVSKEILLAAGSIATPQILMLSGIGPKDHLKVMGIDIILNSPVGKNLQDHIILPLFLKTNIKMELPSSVIQMFLLQYMLTKSGPISNIGLTDYMGFINTKNVSDYPDIQFHYTYFTKNDNFVLRPYLEGIGYKRKIIEAIEALNYKNDILGIYPTLLHPKARGDIFLSERDLSKPIINANYFQHSDDMLAMIEAIDFIHTLEKTSTFEKYNIKLLHINISECDIYPFDTEKYWECYIKYMATTIYHPVGTTKMGPPEDASAVVNSELIVHGTPNIRVVDASIMPNIPGGNTMAATLAIAEKAFDIVKKKYVLKNEL
ncbi:glucose dehydrogenase [FAD, quinone]-like [Danaus plexippus]|uniref:glucose dehydrogenase [FAD, quinone]-like n=1 Tax=Danaus plexippus TaxID=13037 RepID=UPI002AB0A39E|nr:glucose dehydrogenase [FAD, quinone]-like [Danaus plexippus]